MKTGVSVFSAERRRQVAAEGFSADRDDKLQLGQLAAAAACYLVVADLLAKGYSLEASSRSAVINWPFDRSRWRPSSDARENLRKAGALAAAEYDRLERIRAARRSYAKAKRARKCQPNTNSTP